MKPQTLLQVLSLSAALFSGIDAAPARPDSKHPLKGSEALVGYSATEDITTRTKPDLKYSLAPGQMEDTKIGTYLDFQKVENPQPIRGSTGGDDPGPRKLAYSCSGLGYRADILLGNYNYDRINSDKLAPPGTDHGQTINAQWPLGESRVISMRRNPLI